MRGRRHAAVAAGDAEHRDGSTLAAVVAEHAEEGRRVDGGRIWRWLAQLGSALQYLHARRILHRDLKTENVFLDADDNLKLGDFGIARSLSTQTALAATVVGTPAYMSPEVINSDEYGEPADAWAVGVVLVAVRAAGLPDWPRRCRICDV